MNKGLLLIGQSFKKQVTLKCRCTPSFPPLCCLPVERWPVGPRWHPPPLEGRPPLMPVAAIYYCYQPNWRPHLFPLHSIMASKHIKHNLYKQKNCWKMSLFHITPEHQDILEKKDSSSCSKVVFDHQYNSEVRWTGEKLKGVPGGGSVDWGDQMD